ncbi:MAG: hypothetical protein SVN78_00650 [Deferribacterota bacterium]|nr:hypothetical protein [Deferribacterota bacterium]
MKQLMRLLTKNSYIIFITLLISCYHNNTSFLKRDYNNLDNSGIRPKVLSLNKPICSYRKKAKVILKNNVVNEEFNAIIVNNCRNITLNILGLFNRTAMTIKVVDDRIFVEGDKDLEKALGTLIDDKHIREIVKIFTIPMLLPDESYRLINLGDNYLFSKNNEKIYVNNNYLIYMIELDEGYIHYNYNNNILDRIVYKNNEIFLTVDFI